MDIVGFYTQAHCGNGGGCSYSTSNASSNPMTLNQENQITGGTEEATFYTGIDFMVVLFSADQQYYSANTVRREGGSAYQVYTSTPCHYQGDIDAGYQCFATAVTYHIECTGSSGRESCDSQAWKETGSATSVGYTGTQYSRAGFSQCLDYPNSPYGVCYH